MIGDDSFINIPSIYDGEEENEVLPRAGGFFFESSEWIKAQSTHAGILAEANFLIGLLAERFKWMGQPAVNRLAKREAAALSTLAGDRIPTDQLNIYIADRKQGVAEDTLGYRNADWAYRRLASGGDPLGEPLRDFLGRVETQNDNELPEFIARAGVGFTDQADGWVDDVNAERLFLSPLVLGAFAFFAWEAQELSPDRLYEPAVVSQCLMAKEFKSAGIAYVPMSLNSSGAFRRTGEVSQRLERWINTCMNATQSTLNGLRDLQNWQIKAERYALSSRRHSIRDVLDIFVEYDFVTANMINERLNVAHSTSTRTLNKLVDDGLIRETTHQQKFRIWRIV